MRARVWDWLGMDRWDLVVMASSVGGWCGGIRSIIAEREFCEVSDLGMYRCGYNLSWTSLGHPCLRGGRLLDISPRSAEGEWRCGLRVSLRGSADMHLTAYLEQGTLGSWRG